MPEGIGSSVQVFAPISIAAIGGSSVAAFAETDEPDLSAQITKVGFELGYVDEAEDFPAPDAQVTKVGFELGYVDPDETFPVPDAQVTKVGFEIGYEDDSFDTRNALVTKVGFELGWIDWLVSIPIEFRIALDGGLRAVKDIISGYQECIPTDLLIVLDHSTSMNAVYGSSTRFQAAKDAILNLIDLFEDSNTDSKIGIVVYSTYWNDGFGVEGAAATLLSPYISNDWDGLRTAITSEGTGGYGTPTGSALGYARTLLETIEDEDRKQAIIVISDGEWNIGADPIPVAQGIVADHDTWRLIAVDVNNGTPNPSNVEIGNIGDGFFGASSPEELEEAVGNSVDPCTYPIPLTFEIEFTMFEPADLVVGGCLGTDQPEDTAITEVETEAMALQLRVHRHQMNQMNGAELYYCREDDWQLFPIQPHFSKERPIEVSHAYRQPGTCKFSIPDNFGLLNRHNRNSPYNYRSDTVTFDPILKAKRKIMLRCGTLCYENLTVGITPTASEAPVLGDIEQLTDDVIGDILVGGSPFIKFQPSSLDPIDIDIDLGEVKLLVNYAIRFHTKSGFFAVLPASVNWGWSTDGVTWHYTKHPRPIGGDGGDWEDDLGVGGKTVEAFKTDLQVYGRYVRFRITPAQENELIFLDEIAVYGGDTIGFLGGSYFVGYIGGDTTPNPDGNTDVVAIDCIKKLIDNNSSRLTPQFGGQLGPIDAGDIIYTLLTSAAIWKGDSGQYHAPHVPEEIGWTYGSNAAGFKFPVWQGQSNNVYGYIADLLHSIGFDYQIDHEGIHNLHEPPYRQVIPDRVLIADADGNNDCWNLTPHDDDVDLRNKIIVRSANPRSGGTATVKVQPNSIAQYGELVMEIDDPIAFDETTREKIGSYILRDYAFRLGTLTGIIKPDFLSRVGTVIAFRASRRMSMYAKAYAASENIRAQQLWLIESLDESIWVGDWTASVKCNEYVGLGPNSPTNVSATPNVDDTIIDLDWDAPSDADVVDYAIYVSSISDSQFPAEPSFYVGGITTAFAVTGLTPATQYWFYVTAIGQNGQESVPSSVVTAEAGGAPGDDSNWTITDLDATFVQSREESGDYEYEVLLTFTSPPVGADAFEQANFGFKHGEFRYAVGAIPDDDDIPNSWLYQDEWHGDRVPSLLTWDRASVGDLTWYLRFRSSTDLSGETLYFRIFTWQTTNGFHGPAHPSNIVSVVLP